MEVLLEEKEGLPHLILNLLLKGVTSFDLTKMDVLYPECAGITEYSKLPTSAKKFVEDIESELGLQAVLIGTGADVNAIIDRRNNINKIISNHNVF